MFGAEKKKKKVADWDFDLEVELKDPAALKKRKNEIAERITNLKNKMRSGGDKQSFDDAQVLLHGYLATEKVIERMSRK